MPDATAATVLRTIVAISAQYYECAARHAALADAVR
jgi:hypothetical protein